MVVKIGNIFDSDCSVLVNTVNCVGVMGKGIALDFRKKYPNMYADYKFRCDNGAVRPGEPYMYTGIDGESVLLFPTKDHWRSPSKLSYIVDGLDWFADNYERLGIDSIAFPPLGCGNGGLNWRSVGPVMYQKLASLPIDVEIYAPFGTSEKELTKEFLSKPVSLNELTGSVSKRINPSWYLILQVVKELNERKYVLRVGRTTFQKICYVITRNGVDTGFSFSKGTYGPFSADIKQAVTILANANLITETRLDKMIAIDVTENFSFQKSAYSPEEWDATKRTVDLFSRLKNTNQAEMIATVLFAYDQLVESNNSVSDKDVYDYVLDWKPRWKADKEYELIDAINNLTMLSYMKVKHSKLLEDTDSY